MKKLLQKAKSLLTGKTEPATRTRRIDSYERYIYLNPGLNRHERRSLAAKLAKNRNRSIKSSNYLDEKGVAAAKWSLNNSPWNIPATWRRLKENSVLRQAGEAIKIFARENTNRDKS